jgi:hypothetical protein
LHQVKAAYAMVQIVEILTQIEGKDQKEKMRNIDFHKFGDLVMDFIEDEAYTKMTINLSMAYYSFQQQRCWTISKFLLCAMQENMEIGKKSELAKKYKNCRANKFMNVKDNDLNQEMAQIHIKLMILKNIFRDSIDYLDFGTETELFSFDEKAGQILMGKLKYFRRVLVCEGCVDEA